MKPVELKDVLRWLDPAKMPELLNCIPISKLPYGSWKLLYSRGRSTASFRLSLTEIPSGLKMHPSPAAAFPAI